MKNYFFRDFMTSTISGTLNIGYQESPEILEETTVSRLSMDERDELKVHIGIRKNPVLS